MFAVKLLTHQGQHERQLMSVIELFMQDDVRACTVMDYVIVFFRLVLAKLRQRGQDFDDIKQLHLAMSDEDVAQTFRTVLSKLAFPAAEQRAIRTALDALQHHKWPTSHVMTTSPGGDAQITSALLYLRLQHGLERVMNSALQRALCAAHECILTDVAINKTPDVNLNACDVSTPHDACLDAATKPDDDASFAVNRSGLQSCEKLRSPDCATQTNVLEPISAAKECDAVVTGQGSDVTCNVSSAEIKDSVTFFSDSSGPTCPSCTASGVEPSQGGATLSSPTSTTMPGVRSIQDRAAASWECPVYPPVPGEKRQGDRESPDVIDHARFLPDPKFYVICYDDSTTPCQGPVEWDQEEEGEDRRCQVAHGRA